MSKKDNAVTLMELLVALILLTIIVMGLGSIDLFSRFHVISSGRRSRLQNEVSLALDHMSKHIVVSYGNEVVSGPNTVISVAVNNPNVNGDRISFHVDSNDDGTAELWRACRYNGNRIEYCPNCTDGTAVCNACNPAWGSDPANSLGTHITNFQLVKPHDAQNRLTDNFVLVTVGACWDVANPGTCGSQDNPSVNMNARIVMPSVTTH